MASRRYIWALDSDARVFDMEIKEVGLNMEISKIGLNLKKRAVIAIAGAFLLSVSGLALAEQSFIGGATILNLSAFQSNNGVCRAKIDKNVNTDGDAQLNCGNTSFVSFGCDGQNNPKSSGNTMFNLAQLAMVTGRKVNLYVEDTLTYNVNVCTVTFIAVNS